LLALAERLILTSGGTLIPVPNPMPTDSKDARLPSRLTNEDHAAFLGRDFDQAFSEKRRLEDQVWDICKFAFTADSALVGLAIGAYRYSLDRTPDLVPAATVVLAITLAVGLFFVLLMVRTRIYFVAVSRYINEQRAFFLRGNPLGFQNSTGFYTDPTTPGYFSWVSTQTWATLLVVLFNAVAGATLVFLLARQYVNRGTFSALSLAVIFIVQLLAIRAYLRAQEGRAATYAVRGKRG